MIEGVLAALEIPTNYVTPQSWQKAVGARGGKDASRARAAELFPAYAANFTRKKDDGRADAALIAWYGAQL
jgi:crossover junction endodeoxyribonuclease RuvC